MIDFKPCRNCKKTDCEITQYGVSPDNPAYWHAITCLNCGFTSESGITEIKAISLWDTDLEATIDCLENPEDYPEYPNECYWGEKAKVKKLLATLKSISNVITCHGTPKQFKRMNKILKDTSDET